VRYKEKFLMKARRPLRAGVDERATFSFAASFMRTFIALLALSLAAVSAPASNDSSKAIHNTVAVESSTYRVTAKRFDPEENQVEKDGSKMIPLAVVILE